MVLKKTYGKKNVLKNIVGGIPPKNFPRRFFPNFVFLFFFAFWSACSTSQRTQDPTLIPELRGVIRPDKAVYSIHEEIKVSYWLQNIGEGPLREQVTDGSRTPKTAFEGYSFNAVSEESNKRHLTLKGHGTPLQGILDLPLKEEKKFVENTFQAEEPGYYILSFDLRWRDGKKVPFKQMTIRVTSQKGPEETTDPVLAKALSQLASSDYSVRAEARQAIKELGEKATRGLVLSLNDKDTRLREEAMFILVDMKYVAVPALIEGARHPDRETRLRSIYALGQIGDERGIPLMMNALLSDPDREIRSTVLRIVSDNMVDEIAVPVMIKALNDSLEEMRTEVFQALRKRTNPPVDFRPDSSLEERNKAIEQIKQWWMKSHPNAFK